jgi:hypothetical protein
MAAAREPGDQHDAATRIASGLEVRPEMTDRHLGQGWKFATIDHSQLQYHRA